MPNLLQIAVALATLSMASSSGVADGNSTIPKFNQMETIEDGNSRISTITPTTATPVTIITETTEIPKTSRIKFATTTSIPTQVTFVTENTTKVELQQPSKITRDPLNVEWECPNIRGVGIECSCDFPHTLRCTGDRTALQVQ